MILRRFYRSLRLAAPLAVMTVAVFAGMTRPSALSQAGPEAATMERLRTLSGMECYVKSTTTLIGSLDELVAADAIPPIVEGVPAIRVGDLDSVVRAWKAEFMGQRAANAWIVASVDGEWIGLELRPAATVHGDRAWVAVDRIAADAACDGHDDG